MKVKTPSILEKILAAGHMAVTSECGPPRGSDPEVIVKKANLIKDHVDAINITDNQTSVTRMCSLAACIRLKLMGIEPVLQMVTRDRNRIALQSDILGAAAFDIYNILCLSGDHQSFGDCAQGQNVHDIDSMQLIQTVRHMRDEGKFLNDEEHGVQVKDVPGLWMVPETLVVTGKTEHVSDTHGIGAQDITLNGQTVSIPADHLENGLNPFLYQYRGSGPAGHSNYRCLIIGDIYRVYHPFQVGNLFLEMVYIRTLWRTAFAGKGKVPGSEDLFKIAFGFQIVHSTSPSLTLFRGPPSLEVCQSLASVTWSKSSRRPCSIFFLTIISQTQSTSLEISHFPLAEPPQGPLRRFFEQRAMGHRPPVR